MGGVSLLLQMLHVFILEPIVYCNLFVKEDKTGKGMKYIGNMYCNAWYLFYIMRVCKRN